MDIVFYGNADRYDELHLGWELEVDSDHRVDRERIAGGVKDILFDFVTCEDDGSLSSQAGFEIISQPASLKYHLSMMPKYTEVFEYLTDNEILYENCLELFENSYATTSKTVTLKPWLLLSFCSTPSPSSSWSNKILVFLYFTYLLTLFCD